MKITRSQLSRIIKEETTRAIREGYGIHGPAEGDPEYDLDFDTRILAHGNAGINHPGDRNQDSPNLPVDMVDELGAEVSITCSQNLASIRGIVFDETGARLDVRDLLCLAISVSHEKLNGENRILSMLRQIFAEVHDIDKSHADD